MSGRTRRALFAALAAAMLVAGVSVSAARAESGPEVELVDADLLLARGDYEAAIAAYLDRIEAGERSSAIHYNLGLAYAHSDQLGLATYHITQAHFLALGDEYITISLALLKGDLRRQHVEGQTDELVAKGEPKAIFWLEFFHAITRTEVEIGLIVFCWLAFGLLLWRRRLPPSGRRDTATVLAIVFLILTLGAAAYRAGAEISQARVLPGVVVDDSARLHEGPDRLATRHIDSDLFLGATVLIREERNAWYRVELANGRSGWLPEDVLRRVSVSER